MVDEAQAIKNAANETTQQLKRIPARVRIALVAASFGAYAFIFLHPLTQDLFHLDSSNTLMMVTGLVVGGVGAVLVELVWWIRGWVFGEKHRFWKSPELDPREA